MNLSFFSRGESGKRNLLAEARRYRLMQNLRALLLVLPVVAFAAALAVYFLSGKPTEVPKEWRSPSFSGVHSRQELIDVVKASRAAYNEYLKIDKVGPQLDRVAKIFENVRSEADLAWALNEFRRVSGDKYAEVLSIDEYQDRMARQSGATIGIDIQFEVQRGSRNVFVISRCPADSEAYAAGLRQDDELVSIDNTHIDQIPQSNPWQTAQRLKQMVDNGLLGSVCKIVCRRNDVAIEAEVKRTVLTTWEARQTLSVSNIWQFGDGAAYQIQIQNLWNPDTLTELIEKLKQMDKNEVRGILLDLRNVTGCDGDTAVRIAALFMENGVIAHRIQIQPDGTLLMHSWEAKDGKVQLTTKGPFKVNSDGAINPEPAKTPQVEMLDWESNVFKNTVVAIMSNETSGGGEVIAAGLMADFKRHVVTSEYLSAGKGTYQSYFQVGPEHVIALSTAFYLRPDGTPFEKGADGKGMMPNGIPRGNFRTIEEFANHLLEERLSVVPVPDLPPEPKPEPKAGPEVKK